MKIDEKKLNQAIDKMTSVCDKGKDEIRTVLSEGFGLTLQPKKEPLKTGQVYLDTEAKDHIVIVSSHRGSLCIMGTRRGFVYGDRVSIIQQRIDKGTYKLVADSIEDYKAQA